MLASSSSHKQSYINKYNSVNLKKSKINIKHRKRSIVKAKKQINYENPKNNNIINSIITTSLAITLPNVISDDSIAQTYDNEIIEQSHQNQITTLIQNNKNQNLEFKDIPDIIYSELSLANESDLQKSVKIAAQKYVNEQQRNDDDDQSSSSPISFNFPQISMPNFKFSLPQQDEEKSTNDYFKSNINTEIKNVTPMSVVIPKETKPVNIEDTQSLFDLIKEYSTDTSTTTKPKPKSVVKPEKETQVPVKKQQKEKKSEVNKIKQKKEKKGIMPLWLAQFIMLGVFIGFIYLLVVKYENVSKAMSNVYNFIDENLEKLGYNYVSSSNPGIKKEKS